MCERFQCHQWPEISILCSDMHKEREKEKTTHISYHWEAKPKKKREKQINSEILKWKVNI